MAMIPKPSSKETVYRTMGAEVSFAIYTESYIFVVHQDN